MSTGDGPKAFDGNQALQQASAGKSSGGGGGWDSEIWGPLGGGLRRFANALLFNPFTGKHLKWQTTKDCGIDAHFGKAQGFLDKKINEGAASMSSGGGFLAKAVTEKLQLTSAKDFSKIVEPSNLPRFQVAEAPIGSPVSPSSGFGSGGGGLNLG